MMDRARLAALAALALLIGMAPGAGATPAEPHGAESPPIVGRGADPLDGPFAAGAALYRTHCAACHDAGNARAPQRLVIQDMTPQAIHRALTEGAMREQGAALSTQERRAVSEYLAMRQMPAEGRPAFPATCKGRNARFDWREPPPFRNWGLDPAGTHEIPTRAAGLTRANAPRLKLKWAFGFPDSARMRSQPALAGGAIILGNHSGAVVALDRETGCLRWSFEASAEVRTGITVQPWRAGDRKANPLAFFGDVTGNLYAIEAATGRLAWQLSADDHPAAVLTGTPALHRGTLYVPVSSIEESSASAPGYACCDFRGSILALDARTGAQKWRTWLVGEPSVQGRTADGRDMLGPSGVSVWNSPAIDAARGQLYVATGDNYSQPATELSDAVVAIDLITGRVRWHYQALAGDAWNVGCILKASGNCPEDAGPDHDFGAGTMLARGTDGRELVLAGQKSGIVHALDPDSGKPVWQTRVGRGGVTGGVLFGMAASAGRLFAPVMDRSDDAGSAFPRQPGLHALDIATGKVAWHAPLADRCKGRRLCQPGYDGSITATPELVLAGGADGFLRVYDAADGTVLWELDTARPFETVNGVAAKGGAIGGGAAPIAWKGNLIAVSGYGFASKMPGNVLLVFETR